MNRTLLLHFTGPDRSGILGELASALAGCDVTLLDIGQTALRGATLLSLQIELPAGVTPASLPQALTPVIERLGLKVSVTTLQDRPSPPADVSRFLVTLLGKTLEASHIAGTAGLLAERGLNIDRVERLSQSLSPGSAAPSGAGACLEMRASGPLPDEPALRAALLAVADELDIDIAFQRESLYRRNRRLFAFDMDSTLIQGEVIDELARMAGVGDQVSAITAAAMRGEIDFSESFRRRVSLLRGLTQERVYSLLGSIPLVCGAERLLGTLRLLGYKTAILSGGFTFFANHLQQTLGIDYVHANELEIEDGVVTGRVLPPIVDGARKAALLAEIAAKERISLEQVVAVGDGANDLPMLSLAGMGVAFHAKPLVRRSASHALSRLGLDSLLYLIGVRDRDLAALEGSGNSY